MRARERERECEKWGGVSREREGGGREGGRQRAPCMQKPFGPDLVTKGEEREALAANNTAQVA